MDGLPVVALPKRKLRGTSLRRVRLRRGFAGNADALRQRRVRCDPSPRGAGGECLPDLCRFLGTGRGDGIQALYAVAGGDQPHGCMIQKLL